MTEHVGGRKTLLLIDDDADLRAALAELLRDEGWNAVEARDGEEGLRLALELRPPIIVVDHRMPRMTGADVCRALQASGLATSVILITAARDVGALAESLGIACYLGKPFELDALLMLLRRASDGECG
jgi:two-component system response regulator (stage 0 sporulation protein F)